MIVDPHAFNRGWLGGTQWYFQMQRALTTLGWDLAVVSARNRGVGAREVDTLFPGRLFRTPFGTIPAIFNHRYVRHAWRLVRIWAKRPPEEDRWSKKLVRWQGRQLQPCPLAAADLLCAVTYHYWGPVIAVRALAQELGLPYWIDIHDPMKGTKGPGAAALPEEKLRAYRDAAQVVTTTETYAERLREMMPEIARRVTCLRLTHNPETLLNAESPPRDGRLVLLYMGYLYGSPSRSAVPLLDAIVHLQGRAPETQGMIALRLVGQGPGVSEAQAVAGKLGLGRSLECVPQVSPGVLRQYVVTSDVLCLFMPAVNAQIYQVPGKTYDYLYSNKPILAVVPPGEIANIVEQTQAGFAVHPDDTEGLAALLKRLLEQKQASGTVAMTRDLERLKPYSFETFRDTLEGILKDCLSDDAGEAGR